MRTAAAGGTRSEGKGTSVAPAGRRLPAPGGLELVRAFLNSADIEAGTDAFSTADGVATWSAAHGLELGGPVPEADRERVVRLREALRELITCRDAVDPLPSGALAVLDAAARSGPLAVAFAPDGAVRLGPVRSGVDGLAGRILSEVSTAAVAGTWPRLKVCRNDACRWAYYDASRNRSGVWCTMAVCGNRSKGQALRARRRGAPTA